MCGCCPGLSQDDLFTILQELRNSSIVSETLQAAVSILIILNFLIFIIAFWHLTLLKQNKQFQQIFGKTPFGVFCLVS